MSEKGQLTEFYKKFPEVRSLYGCWMWPRVVLSKAVDDVKKEQIKKHIKTIKPGWEVQNTAFKVE